MKCLQHNYSIGQCKKDNQKEWNKRDLKVCQKGAIMTLHNKKIKINIENYQNKRHLLSQPFIDFLDDSEDKVFIAKRDKKYPSGDFYTLKESEIDWLFHESDLIKVEKSNTFLGNNKRRKRNLSL
jgi:hypothetical protein